MRPIQLEVINNPVEVLPPKRSIALTSVGHCRAELATVYRQARLGQIQLADATKLAFVLVSLSRMIEISDLEARVLALEKDQ